jgi:hypothetical protein
MNREILQAMQEGAMNALRLYAALILAPFHISKAFVMRPPGEPFRWPPDSGRAPPDRSRGAQLNR